MTLPTKTTHGLVIFDYNGPDPRVPNIHAFGFMQTDDIDRGLDDLGHAIRGYHVAQDVAHEHWQKHLTFIVRDKIPYEVQHVFAYEAGVLIDNLFDWGTDLALFDPTLPKEA